MASQAHFEAVRERYGLGDWRLADERPVAVRHFTADLTDTPYALVEREPRGDGGHHFAEHYARKGEGLTADAGIHLIVEIAEYATAADAREQLVVRLSMMMAPRLPDCAECGIEAGDRCFCGVDRPPSAVIFVRGNVLVDISNAGSEREPVAPLAQAIDRQILAAAGLAPLHG